jgi:hypothetical protein
MFAPLVVAALCAQVAVSSPPPAAQQSPPSPSTGPADLALRDEDVEARIAHGLATARRGEVRAALAELDLVLASATAAPLSERAATERMRFETWLALREAFADELVLGAAKISLELGGEKLVAVWKKREGDLVSLDANKLGRSTLSLEEVPPVAIAELMGRSSGAAKTSWSRFWAYAVCGDERWKKMMKETGGEAAKLRSDGESVYPALLRVGEAAHALAALAQSPEPTEPAAAEAELAGIDGLRKSFGDLSLVQGRSSALRERAAAALHVQFQPLGLAACVKGRLESLEGGRARVTYRFDEPKELEDFRADPEYDSSHRSDYPEVAAVEGKEKSPSEIKSGGLVVRGATCLRQELWLAGPLRVRYRIEHKMTSEPDENFVSMLLIGLFDDGAESFVTASQFGSLKLRVKSSNTTRIAEAEQDDSLGVYGDTPYDYELLVDDAGKLQASRDGKVLSSLDVTPLSAGQLFLWVHSTDRIVVHELSIEGLVTPETLARAEVRWTNARLAELGFETR